MGSRWSIGFVPGLLLAVLSGPAFAWSPPVLMTKWGSQGSAPGQFANVAWPACSAGGNVYVSDFGNNRIQVFTNNGIFLTQWGTFGTGNGQFNEPMQIAVDGNGDVYVVDYNNVRIEKFTNSGVYITQFGASGYLDGEFRTVGAIATDASGNVYACDSNPRIQKFTGTGTFLTKWGTKGTGDGQFTLPRGIAVGPNGHVYVLDVDPLVAARVQEFTSSGAFIRKWGTEGVLDSEFVDPRGMAIDGSGRVYVTDEHANRVVVFSSDGIYLGKWGTQGSGSGQFMRALGVAVDASDHVFVSDANLYRVQKFGGSSVAYFPTLGSVRWVPNSIAQLHLILSWDNPGTQEATLALSGTVFPQPFGAFMPDGPPVGGFDVPPVPPGSRFDVFVDVPMDQLPPSAPRILPGGGPGPGDPCPPPGWAGNVDVVWSEAGAPARSDWHGGDLLVAPGAGYSYVHVVSGCASPQPAPWEIAGVCPGFTATLVEPDRVTPAPDSLPPGWDGFIRVAADGPMPIGTSCCFDLFLTCDEVPGRIQVCATTCAWAVSTGVPRQAPGDGFGIVDVSPNPADQAIAIRFAVPHDQAVTLEVFDAAGRRLRTLVDAVIPRGDHVQRWDGLGSDGGRLRPGTYFVRLRTVDRQDSRAITRVR